MATLKQHSGIIKAKTSRVCCIVEGFTVDACLLKLSFVDLTCIKQLFSPMVHPLEDIQMHNCKSQRCGMG
jgi:hypothetical protein